MRPLLAGAVLLLSAVLAACATTVDGTGVALKGTTTSGSSPSTSKPGFPVESDSPSATPTGGGSGSISVTPNPGGGVLATYPAGHFKAVFPEEPQTQSQPGNLGPVSFTVYIATVQGKALAACEDFTPSIDESGYDTTLKSAVASFTTSSGLTLQSQQATKFQSHTARSARLTNPSGDPFDLIVFIYSNDRLYILFGEEGDVFDTLQTSFQALP